MSKVCHLPIPMPGRRWRSVVSPKGALGDDSATEGGIDLAARPGILRVNLTPKMPAMHPIPLEYLKRGEHAEVAEVHGEPSWVGRLAELGIRTGSRLEVLQPGTHCVLMVGESRLSLRSSDASQILVHPVVG